MKCYSLHEATRVAGNTRRRTLRRVLLTIAVALPCSSAFAAEEWPSRPLRIVVPYAAGGNSDQIVRPLEPRLSDVLGQPVIIDNRPGAGTQLGTDIVAKAQPDGYTLLYVPAPFVVNPSIRKLPYTPADFAPITQLMTSPLVLVVNRAVQVSSVSDLIRAARAQPGKFSFGSGFAGAGHLAGELLKSVTGIDMVHVPYKGSSPAMVALIGGEIQLVFATPSEAIPQIKAERVKALAVTTPRRSPALPELPTVSESGIKGFNVSVWGGLAAPAKTPRPVIKRLHDEVVKLLALPEIREHYSMVGAEPVGSTPEQFGAFLRNEIALWSKVVKQAKIHLN